MEAEAFASPSSGSLPSTGISLIYVFQLLRTLDSSLSVSPGLLLDATVTTLKEEGFDITKPGVTMPVDRETESRIETKVTHKAICLINGLDQVSSFFDSRLVETSTISGSSYSVRGGRVQRHDFTLTTPTQRTSTGLLKYDPTAIPLPGMSSSTASGAISVLNFTAEG